MLKKQALRYKLIRNENDFNQNVGTVAVIKGDLDNVDG